MLCSPPHPTLGETRGSSGLRLEEGIGTIVEENTRLKDRQFWIQNIDSTWCRLITPLQSESNCCLDKIRSLLYQSGFQSRPSSLRNHPHAKCGSSQKLRRRQRCGLKPKDFHPHYFPHPPPPPHGPASAPWLSSDIPFTLPPLPLLS